MVVYIDVLIFTNIIINYCILSLTKKFLHIKVKEFRIILSAFVGALFSLTVFIESLSEILSITLKLLCTIVMCLIAFNITQIKIYIKCVCATFGFSVMFCGVMIFVHNFSKAKNIAIINDTVYFQIDSITLILLSIITYIVITVIQRIVSNDFQNTIVNLKIKIKNDDYSCVAKIDTGCSVTEPFSGAPVIIVESSLLNDINDANRVIPYKALGCDGILKGIKADKITIDKKVIEKDVYIGIYKGTIDPQFKAIINHKIVR